MTTKVGERDILTSVVFEAEGRGLVTGFEHARSSAVLPGDVASQEVTAIALHRAKAQLLPLLRVT